MVGGCFFMFLAVRFMTVMIMSNLVQVTGAEITNVVNLFEANPLAKWLLNLKQMSFIANFIMLPAISMALYLYFRQRVKNGKMEFVDLCYFVNFAFIFLLINVVNDGASLAGRLI